MRIANRYIAVFQSKGNSSTTVKRNIKKPKLFNGCFRLKRIFGRILLVHDAVCVCLAELFQQHSRPRKASGAA